MSKRIGARASATAASLLAGSLLAASALAGDGSTTRIEPRPYYGAVVTIEEGVRVFRPLPPTKHVIINPGGSTPLSLGFSETRVYEHRSSTHYGRHHHEHYGARRGSRCHPAVGSSC
ncbi:MAG: hypothetical protein NW205_02020 [Hyphomicrobiaceae bacterium]|nr:hypothetical protein [Hyphomicrobiaceae bacterium]